MVGIAEDDLCVEVCGFEGFKANALHGAGRADRHEGGRLDLTAARGQHTRTALRQRGLRLGIVMDPWYYPALPRSVPLMLLNDP